MGPRAPGSTLRQQLPLLLPLPLPPHPAHTAAPSLAAASQRGSAKSGSQLLKSLRLSIAWHRRSAAPGDAHLLDEDLRVLDTIQRRCTWSVVIVNGYRAHWLQQKRPQASTLQANSHFVAFSVTSFTTEKPVGPPMSD